MNHSRNRLVAADVSPPQFPVKEVRADSRRLLRINFGALTKLTSLLSQRRFIGLAKLMIVMAFAVGALHYLAAEVGSQTISPSSSTDLVFIDNGQIKVGVKKSSGCGIAWFSTGQDGRNLVNHWDRGRLIQQSYYGREDGSMWNKQPWRWNPVQGGDWKGHPATTLEFKRESDSLYAKTRGKHWASGEDLTNVVFEETIRLDGKVAHVHFKFTYTGDVSHPIRDQEIPAVFVEPDLDTLVLYEGDKPWTGGELNRSKPGWPNESRKMTEHWAAYVDGSGKGFGVLVPVATNLTCYRFGDGKAEHGSCSYFAPLTRFAITPGKVFEYDVYLTAGTVEEIRDRFQRIAKK